MSKDDFITVDEISSWTGANFNAGVAKRIIARIISQDEEILLLRRVALAASAAKDHDIERHTGCHSEPDGSPAMCPEQKAVAEALAAYNEFRWNRWKARP